VAELPSGTVTFLFTDIEGSTRLWEEHPDSMRGALARHDELVRAAIEGHRGHVVKTTGDGFHAAFVTAGDAVDAAVEMQRALVAEEWSTTGPVRVRVGVHTGAAEIRDGDYYGTALNRAARLMSVGHGGQILVSLATEELLEDLDLADLGEHVLRDVSRPERIFQVRAAGLPTDFPPLRSTDESIGNLPLNPNPFVGRTGLVDQVVGLLADTPVVSLTGPGGVGKTRLALQVARRLQPEFADGAWFVDLAPVATTDRVTTVVLDTLGYRLAADEEEVPGLCTRLRRRCLLLVLDNCEHVVDGIATMVDAISTSAPDVRVVVTSREGLGIPAERVQPVRPMAMGADGEAVELFVMRARGARPDFALDDETTAVVVELCQRLDGIPLAIELAAARTRSLPPATILERLDERFRMLTGGSRTAVPRHQTLQAAVDWSYDLLTDPERAVLDRLSVFAGSFPLDAAEFVASDDHIDAFAVLEHLSALVHKSLVVADPDEASYRLLETIRQYAATRLAAAGTADDVRARHAAYYRELVATCAPALRGASDVATMERLSANLENLRLMLDWYQADGQLDVVADLIMQLGFFLFWRGHMNEMRPRLESTLAGLGGDHALRSRVHGVLAWMSANLGLAGIREEAGRSAEEAALAGIPTPLPALNALSTYAVIAAGDTQNAIERVQVVVDAARAEGDFYWATWAQINAAFYRAMLAPGADDTLRSIDELRPAVERIGSVVLDQNLLTASAIALGPIDLDRSLSMLATSSEMADVEHFSEGLAQSEFFRGLALFRSRRYAEAATALRRALVGNHDAGNRRGMSNVLSAVVGVAERTGRSRAAAQLLDGLLAARREYLLPGSEFERRAEATLGARLGVVVQSSHASTGSGALDLEATIDVALDTLDDIALDAAR
jgi:predicted ATPase/class 3 adenylate cyclase